MEDNYILYVEDDDDDREAFVAALKIIRPGLKIRFADHGVHALSILKTANVLPQYVVIDLNLPLMNGLELLTEIRNDEKLAGLSCMILSTGRSNNDIKESNDLSVIRYVTKQSNMTTYRALLDLNLPF